MLSVQCDLIYGSKHPKVVADKPEMLSKPCQPRLRHTKDHKCQDEDQDQISQDQDQDLQKVVLNGLKTKTWS